jgi:predicted DCC family thiol-disulfide oxidoreductase YuxK
MLNKSGSIVFYDGFCRLCSSFMRLIVKKSQQKRISLATIDQMDKSGIKSDLFIKDELPDSLIYYRNGKWYYYSDAVLEIMKDLGGIWKGLYILHFIPKKLRDWIYKIIAKHRFNWFGRNESCFLPIQAETEETIDTRQ